MPAPQRPRPGKDSSDKERAAEIVRQWNWPVEQHAPPADWYTRRDDACEWDDERALVDILASTFASIREEKDRAWLDEIASHGGWASDVIRIRCMAHREHRELNLNAAGPSECGWCAYLRGRDG